MKLQVQIKVLKKYTGYSGTFPRYAPENFLWDNRKRKWKLQTTGSFLSAAGRSPRLQVSISVLSGSWPVPAEHTQHTGINIHQKISQHIANHHVHSKVRNSVSSILSFQFINPIHKLTQSPFLFIDRALKIFLF